MRDFDFENDLDNWEYFDPYKCWDLGCYDVDESYDPETGDETLYCCGDRHDKTKCPLLRNELKFRKIHFII